MADKKAHEKAAEDLRKQQEAVANRWREHPVDQTDGEVFGSTADGNEKKTAIEVHAVDRRVFLNSHGETVLDKEGVIQLRNLLDRAFQTVA